MPCHLPHLPTGSLSGVIAPQAGSPLVNLLPELLGSFWAWLLAAVLQLQTGARLHTPRVLPCSHRRRHSCVRVDSTESSSRFWFLLMNQAGRGSVVAITGALCLHLHVLGFSGASTNMKSLPAVDLPWPSWDLMIHSFTGCCIWLVAW